MKQDATRLRGGRWVVGLLLVCAPAHAQDLPGPDPATWILPSVPEAWTARSTAIGGGPLADVLLSLDGSADSTRLYSSADWGTPSLLAETVCPQDTFDHRVASAAAADVHAALYWTGTFSGPRTARVVKVSRGGGAGGWVREFPVSSTSGQGDVHVSASGDLITAWIRVGTQTHVRVFAADGQMLVERTVNTLGEPLASGLSANGSTLVLMSDLFTTLVDTHTGATTYQGSNVGGGSSVLAVGSSGELFARAMTVEKAYVLRPFVPSGSPLVVMTEAPYYAKCDGISIAPDESVVAFVFRGLWNPFDVLVRVIDLSGSTPAVVYEDRFAAASSWTNEITAVDFSADSRTLAVGMWGDEDGTFPEAVVYRRDVAGAWERIASYEVSGSVRDLALSADGTRLVVAASTRHATGNGASQVRLFDVAPEGLTVAGVASLGGMLTFTQRAEPGRTAFLLASTVPNFPATDLGRTGLLWLSRPHLQMVGMGVTDAAGRASVSYALPTDPSMVGHVLYFQGYSASPRHLTEECVAVTLVP